MARRLINRRRRKRFSTGKQQQLSSPLFRLPQALITEIITHVAASSFTDFLLTKLICKDFYRIAEEEERFIYRQVSLEKFPIAPWRNTEKHSQFFKKCHENKNPEALYREGVVHYFGGAKLDCSIKCLKEAANSGHMGAYYAMGVIYVFSGDELKHKGIAILGSMKKSKILRQKVKDYRESLKFIIRGIWKSPLIKKLIRQSCCTMQHHKKPRGWSRDEIEDEEENICEACSSDLEIESISAVL